MARLVCLNAVHALISDEGGLGWTAIDKRPLPGPARIERLGVAGDEQYDRPDHGGRDKAVYAYALEDLEWWSRELGRDLSPGRFGENLTTSGLDVTNAVIGERWRVGNSVVVEVTMPRIPCATFQRWMQEPQWVKRFFSHGAPGAYLRVVEEGVVSAGDPIVVVHRPDHDVTLADVFTPRQADADRIRRLLQEPDVAPSLAVRLSRFVQAAS